MLRFWAITSKVPVSPSSNLIIDKEMSIDATPSISKRLDVCRSLSLTLLKPKLVRRQPEINQSVRICSNYRAVSVPTCFHHCSIKIVLEWVMWMGLMWSIAFHLWVAPQKKRLVEYIPMRHIRKSKKSLMIKHMKRLTNEVNHDYLVDAHDVTVWFTTSFRNRKK